MAVTTPRRWEAVGGRAAARRGDRRRRLSSGGRRIDGWEVAAALTCLVALGLWLSRSTAVVRPMASTLIVLPAVLAVGIPLARRTAARLPVAGLQGILLTGLSLRLIGLWYRYGAAADALEYHEEGTRLAAAYRAFDLAEPARRPVPGTGTLRMASGVVHALTFDDLLSAFAVFTVAAFAGALLFLRALAVAVPEADHRRYALLLMLWPALVFWPSSLGKEAWMVLFLGTTSLGVAHVLTHRLPRGLAYALLGLVGIGLVRPHVGLLVVASLAVALVLRSASGSRGRQTARVVGAVVALVGGMLLADATAQRFQVDRLGTEQVSQTLTTTVERTSQGGATFDAVSVGSPLQYPMAVVTVLLRPFPGEARSLEGFASSAEAVALAVLLATSWRRLRTALRELRHRPYLLYALGFVLSFCYAFAVIGNFGILARQRTQVLPLLFVLLAMTAVDRQSRWAVTAEQRRTWRGAALGGARRRSADDGSSRPADPTAPPAIGPSARRRAAGPSSSGRRRG